MKAIKMLAVLSFAFAAFAANAAADSYIYWMVSDNVYNLISGEPTTYDYVTVKANGSDTYLCWYNQGSSVNEGSSMYIDESGAGTSAAYWGKFEYSPDTTTFLFELWNEDGSLAGFLNTPWVPSSAIASGETPTGGTVYTLTGVVPEPTSGLLSLFGLAALALRRRRRA